MAVIVPGQEIGSYRVIEQIGKGGMATVFKAYQPSMERFVAVKILPFEFAHNRQFIDRFRREVLTVAKLEHPQILPVYDAGEFEGTPYLVMRYLDAGTLKERINRERLTLDRIDHIFSQLAAALEYAHNADIVHRDVKPSNVMLTARDDVLLTDFGIAKLLGAEIQFTTTGALTGTPAYMSPEQCDGRPVDRRSDIYSLGIVLYEMVTGRVPYEAETPLAVILKHLQAPLPPPSSITEVPPAVEQVILKALAKDPADRFQSAAAFLGAWKTAIIQAAAVDTMTFTPAPPDLRQADTRMQGRPAVIGEASPDTARTPGGEHQRGSHRLWLGGILAVTLIGILLFAGYSLFQVCCSPAIAPTSVDNPPADGAALPFPGEGGTWESWTGALTVFSVALHEGEIYAGGLGGIRVYDGDLSQVGVITVQDGLPSNVVYDLFSDAGGTGDLWAATDEGAARFDGERWVVYGYEDGLDNTDLIHIGRVGDRIVAGAAYADDGGGIYLFDGAGWSRIPDFDSTAGGSETQFDSSLNDALYDENTGLTWFATGNGLGAWDGADWVRYTTNEGLPDNNVYGLGLNPDGQIVAATNTGAVYFDGERFAAYGPTAGERIYAFTVDTAGDLWFPGSGGVFRYDPGNGNWDSYHDGSQFPADGAFAAAAAGDGRVYFATDGAGVVRYEGGEFTVADIPPGPLQSDAGIIITAPSGELLFFEQYGSHIDIYDPDTSGWENTRLDVCCVVPFAFDAEGSLWGGGDTGLWRIDPDGEATNFTTSQGLPADLVVHLAIAQDGTVWALTENALAHVAGLEVVEVLTVEDLNIDPGPYHVVLIDSAGGLWVASDSSLIHGYPDGVIETFTIGDPFTEDLTTIRSLAEGTDGGIWVGAHGEGVYRYLDGDWTRYAPFDPGVQLPSVYVNGITIAPDGSVWFATDNGAARFDGESWWSWGLEDGLSHWNVNSIQVMADGTVWFATSGGVTRWQP